MQTCQVTQRASLRAEGGQRSGPRSTPHPSLIPKRQKAPPSGQRTEFVPMLWKISAEPLLRKRRVRPLPGCCPSPASVLGYSRGCLVSGDMAPGVSRAAPR